MNLQRPTTHQKALALDAAKNFILDHADYPFEVLAEQVRQRHLAHLRLAQLHRIEANATHQAWKDYLAQTHNTDPNTKD